MNDYTSDCLFPDFIKNADNPSTVAPADPDTLEGANDGNYYYNAARDPFRIAHDWA